MAINWVSFHLQRKAKNIYAKVLRRLLFDSPCMTSYFMFVSVDIDECEIFQETCHNCTNSEGSYSCACNAGYTLVGPSTCEGQITII